MLVKLIDNFINHQYVKSHCISTKSLDFDSPNLIHKFSNTFDLARFSLIYMCFFLKIGENSYNNYTGPFKLMQSFPRICSKFEIKTNTMGRSMLLDM